MKGPFLLPPPLIHQLKKLSYALGGLTLVMATGALIALCPPLAQWLQTQGVPSSEAFPPESFPPLFALATFLGGSWFITWGLSRN